MIATFDLESEPRAETVNANGIERYEEGNYLAAMKCFELATRLDPDFAEGWNNRGLLLGQFLELDKAEECFNRALQIQPNYLMALVNRSRIYQQVGRLAEALEDLDAAVILDDASPEELALALYQRGQLLYRQNNPVGAIKDFDVVVYLAPSMAQAWLGRSIAKLQSGDAAGALSDADEALRRCPEEQSAPAYHARGGARCKLRDFRGAVQDYNKAIQLNPEFVEAYISRGNARYHLRDRSCFFDYRMSFRIDSQRAAEEISRIIVEDTRRNAEEVLENCEKHLRINPRDFTAHVRKALTISLLGKVPEAQEHLNRAYEILPDATAPLFLVIQAIQHRTKPRDGK